MNKNEFDINLPEEQRRKSYLVYGKIVLVPVAIFALFVAAFFGRIPLNVDISTLVIMGVMLFVALIFARHSADFGCFVFEQQKNDFQRDLKDFILKTLLTIGKETKSNGNVDEFIARYSSFVRNDGFANVAAAFFSLMGVLGMFISVAIKLPDFGTMNANNFDAQLSALLSSLSSAFYVIIYGILLTLWWMFFERYGMTRFKKLINRQKLATKGFFWSKEEIEQRYRKEGFDSFGQISKIFGYVSNQEFFSELDKVIEKKFLNFQNIVKNEEQAIKLSGEQIKQTLATIDKTQKDQKDIVRTHSDIVNAIYSFNQSLKVMQDNFTQTYARLQTIGDEKAIRLEKSVNQLGENIDKFEAKLEKFSTEILDKQETAMNGFKTAMIEGMQAFNKSFELENNDSLALVDELRADIQKVDDEANEALNAIKNAQNGAGVSDENK